MSGRSLLAASLFLLFALGSAAPGAAQVVEEPHWRRAAGDDADRPFHGTALPTARVGVPAIPARG
jgi:hypothetical protein